MSELIVQKALTLDEVREQLNVLVAKYSISEDDLLVLEFYLASIRAIEESSRAPEGSTK